MSIRVALLQVRASTVVGRTGPTPATFIFILLELHFLLVKHDQEVAVLVFEPETETEDTPREYILT